MQVHAKPIYLEASANMFHRVPGKHGVVFLTPGKESGFHRFHDAYQWHLSLVESFALAIW
jgi:hypothetical protein